MVAAAMHRSSWPPVCSSIATADGSERGKGRAVTGTVVVVGATVPLGRRVTNLLSARGYEVRVARPGSHDHTDVLAGATALVHLGMPVRPERGLDGTALAAPDEAATRRLLGAVGGAGVDTVVWLSSAMVYGAWPDNAVPLTETAPRRPNPGLRFAEERSDRDRQVLEWSDANPGVRVVVLRPAVTVDPDASGWLRRSPWSRTGMQADAVDPPSQFVHLDDLASAFVLAVGGPLVGPCNVAPDGWIPLERLRAIGGPKPRLHLPERAATVWARARWGLGLSGTPPAVLPYTMHPWVVANDRLRAAGWEPGHSNEEAFVEADDGGPFASMDPRRRQLVSLGVVGGLGLGLVAGVVAMVRRHVRGR